MNRKKRIKHRKPSSSPFVIMYKELKNNPKAQEEFLKTLNRKQLKKLNKA